MSKPKSSPKVRKGSIIPQSDLDDATKTKLNNMRNQHGVTTELRRYDNGSVGAFFQNGQFRFVKGNIKGREPGQKVQYRSLSRNAAERAFQRYYRTSNKYSSDKARKAALTRDRCTANKEVISDSRYRNRPDRYDFKGVDDGSRCPKDKKVRSKSAMTNKQYQNLVKGNPNIKNPAEKQAQAGGSNQKPVSLKTAVKLLRQYYAEKYNN